VPQACLVAVRHGQTTWNATGRFQGHADPPLDAEGIAQAELLAAELAGLADHGLLGPGRPGLLSSDLRRAAATAAAVARALGSDLVLDPALRELDLGDWTGMYHAHAKARFPEEYRLWRAGLDIRRGGGETPGEAGQRVATRVEQALAAHPDRSLIVVGHGVALRSGLEALRSRGTVSFSGPAPHLGNCCYFATPLPRPFRVGVSV